jgi:hypothetical protein
MKRVAILVFLYINIFLSCIMISLPRWYLASALYPLNMHKISGDFSCHKCRIGAFGTKTPTSLEISFFIIDAGATINTILFKMVSDSTALTTKVESGSPYQLDTNQVSLIIFIPRKSKR